MLPHGIQTHLITIAEAVALILANRLTPDWLRQELLRFTGKCKENLPREDRNDVEAAEAKAVINAVAYSRSED